jgi:hypothetical protein
MYASKIRCDGWKRKYFELAREVNTADGSQCQFGVGVVLTIKIQADGNNTFAQR